MLYRVPTDGAQAPTVLPQDDFDLIGLGLVHEFEVSPDDERVVDVTGTFGEFLYSVATDGSEQPIPLHSLYADAVNFQISADSSRVVYQTGVLPCVRRCYGFHWSLQTVAIDQPDSVPLYLAQAGQFSDAPRYGISSDSSRVVFVSIVDLFSSPPDGSQPAQQIST